MMRIDVVIITALRKDSLEACLRAVLALEEARAVVVVNGRDGATVESLERLSRETDRVVFSVFERPVSKSRARNAGLNLAEAGIVYFLDDDSRPAPENASLLRRKFAEYPEADIIGGPNLTPAGSPVFQRLSGYALSSRLIAAGMRRRYARGGAEQFCDDRSLILCNLAFRRDVFSGDRVFFDERLAYNEENLLLQECGRRGRKMLFCPDLVVYHERRASLPAFALQVSRSGVGRARMTAIMPGSFLPLYAAPAFLLLYFFSLAFIRPVWYLLPAYAYGAACAVNGTIILVRERESLLRLPTMFVLHIVAHLSYGAGFIRGLLTWKN